MNRSVSFLQSDRLPQEPGQAIRRQANRLGFLLCAVLATMYLFAFGLQLYLLLTGYRGTAQTTETNAILTYLLNGTVSICGMVLPIVVFAAIATLRPCDLLPARPVKFLTGTACFFVCGAVCLLANVPSSMMILLLQRLGLQGNLSEMPVAISTPAIILNVLATAIVPPITEELLFRGLILGKLRQYGDVFAIISSALLFAFLHRNAAQILFAFICGLALGFALVKTNNIWVPISIHMFVNGFYVTMGILRTQFSDVGYAILMYAVLGMAILLALIFLIYLLLRKEKLPAFQQGALTTGKSMGNLFANPGIIIFTAACLILTVARLGGWL